MGKQYAGCVLILLIFIIAMRLLLPCHGTQTKISTVFEKQMEIISVMGSSLTEVNG